MSRFCGRHLAVRANLTAKWQSGIVNVPNRLSTTVGVCGRNKPLELFDVEFRSAAISKMRRKPNR
jgi:hypothetical protein